MKGIIFIAPPTAGKGTQAEELEKKYKFLHISTGDLLREESKKETLEALYINEKLGSGELVDDCLVLDLLEKKLESITENFILDGFPRNLNQAVFLDKILDKFNIKKLYVIYIDIDEETAKQRILGRLQCPKCKKIYNSMTQELKPIKDGICDSCGEVLIKRTDDNEKTIKERFNHYLENTMLLIDYYKNKNLLYHIDGKQDKEKVFRSIEKILGSENND